MAQGDYLTLVDDPYAVTEHIGFLDIVSGKKDGNSFFPHLPNHIPNPPSGLGIEPYGRLIEKKDLGLMQNSSGDQETALHSAGQVSDLRLPLPPEPHIFQHFLNSFLPPLSGQSIKSAMKVEVLMDRQAFLQIYLLRHHSKGHLGLRGLPTQIVAADGDTTRGRTGQGGHHMDCRRLAGAIGTQKAEDLSSQDLEGKALHRLEAPVAFCHLFQANQWATPS
jgi:hypothetical protein